MEVNPNALYRNFLVTIFLCPTGQTNETSASCHLKHVNIYFGSISIGTQYGSVTLFMLVSHSIPKRGFPNRKENGCMVFFGVCCSMPNCYSGLYLRKPIVNMKSPSNNFYKI